MRVTDHDHDAKVEMFGTCPTCDLDAGVTFPAGPPVAGGVTFRPHLDGTRLGAQLQRVADVMSDGWWHGLGELAEATNDPEASVSARLRDLRRWGWAVERRRRTGGTWEYRGTPPG